MCTHLIFLGMCLSQTWWNKSFPILDAFFETGSDRDHDMGLLREETLIAFLKQCLLLDADLT
jgi:hypothetical protein